MAERVGNAHELSMPQLQNHIVRVLKHSIVVSSCLTKAAVARLHQQLVGRGSRPHVAFFAAQHQLAHLHNKITRTYNFETILIQLLGWLLIRFSSWRRQRSVPSCCFLCSTASAHLHNKDIQFWYNLETVSKLA